MTAPTHVDFALDPIARPNGKLYRPRKVAVTQWENEGWPDDSASVVVLGTHDVEAARTAAEAWIRWWYDPEFVATKPEVGWFRLGYGGSQGEMQWHRDEVRGRAGVMFTADHPPDAAS